MQTFIRIYFPSIEFDCSTKSVPSHARIVLNMPWVIQIKNFGSRLAAKKEQECAQESQPWHSGYHGFHGFHGFHVVSMSQIMEIPWMNIQVTGSVWKTTQWYPQIQAHKWRSPGNLQPFCWVDGTQRHTTEKEPNWGARCDAPELLQEIGLWFDLICIYTHIYIYDIYI